MHRRRQQTLPFLLPLQTETLVHAPHLNRRYVTMKQLLNRYKYARHQHTFHPQGNEWQDMMDMYLECINKFNRSYFIIPRTRRSRGMDHQELQTYIRNSSN